MSIRNGLLILTWYAFLFSAISYYSPPLLVGTHVALYFMILGIGPSVLRLDPTYDRGAWFVAVTFFFGVVTLFEVSLVFYGLVFDALILPLALLLLFAMRNQLGRPSQPEAPDIETRDTLDSNSRVQKPPSRNPIDDA